MIVALVAAAALVGAYLLWLLFLAIMSLQRANDAGKISATAYRLGLPILYTGLALDFIANVLIVSVLVLELPREWLVSARLNRLAKAAPGWRRTVARWIATNLLNDFDSRGPHIRFEP